MIICLEGTNVLEVDLSRSDSFGFPSNPD